MNIEDHNKRTISHIAAAEGHIDIIKFLVEETNVNILSNDKWGNTPYSEAKNQEIRDIIKNSLTRESSENSLDRLIIMISTFFYEKPERNLYREFL